MTEPRVRLSAPALDATLAVATFVITATSIAASTPGTGDNPTDLLAYAMPTLVAGLLGWRRRWPITILALSVLLVLGYFALNYPPINLALPLAGALYSCAEAGRSMIASAISAVLLGGAAFFRIVIAGQDPTRVLLVDTVQIAAIMCGAIGLGYAVLAHEKLRVQERAAAEQQAARAKQDADLRIEEERLLLARDLHDVLAHTVSVMSIQADVAAEALGDDDPEVAQRSVALIRQQCANATTELRGTVQLLRGDRQREPVADLADLPGLVERARAAGVEVSVQRSGVLDDLRIPVRTTAYRVIQEAVTNALRHAAAERIDITLARDARQLTLSVIDDGRGSTPGPAGLGLRGISERVGLLGGSSQFGPREAGGFGVCARIPL
ncbi:sensor histidine kinase [Cumulibacter soli]|uniref:sensor histidine kinase n=1 Tax=Cumulibacter soli TaxID=2546344 RepID=UPI0010678D24|nr:histidine kinase [Cumulibacter soli]